MTGNGVLDSLVNNARDGNWKGGGYSRNRVTAMLSSVRQAVDGGEDEDEGDDSGGSSDDDWDDDL